MIYVIIFTQFWGSKRRHAVKGNDMHLECALSGLSGGALIVIINNKKIIGRFLFLIIIGLWTGNENGNEWESEMVQTFKPKCETANRHNTLNHFYKHQQL